MVNELLCQLCGTKPANFGSARTEKKKVFPSKSAKAANWKLYEITLFQHGQEKALETLPPRVQEWWALHQSGMKQIDIAKQTKSGASSVNDAIRRIKNEGEDPYGK